MKIYVPIETHSISLQRVTSFNSKPGSKDMNNEWMMYLVLSFGEVGSPKQTPDFAK